MLFVRPTAAAQFIIKNSLFNLLPGDIRLLDMKRGFAKLLIGFPSAQLASNRIVVQRAVFQPFYRAEDSQTAGGLGLRLSLADRILKIHKGTIHA